MALLVKLARLHICVSEIPRIGGIRARGVAQWRAALGLRHGCATPD